MIWVRRILFGAIALILVALLGFVAWATLGKQRPEALAQAALDSPTNVTLELNSGYALIPNTPAETGFIFYSGGLVTPEAYAAHLLPITQAGFTVFAPQMPLNLAVFNLNAAETIIEDNPQIEYWVIGGHSLGGAMASQFTLNNDDEIDGLVLWASFPAESTDLSNHDITVSSIYGSLDGLALGDEIGESAKLLPADTIFVEIVGGNHAQFGDYGPQGGDNEATISRQDQLAQAVEATLNLLQSVNNQQ